MKPLKTYGILFLLLLGIEILIALYVSDSFVRPFLGDTLVVVLVYCFVMFWLTVSNIKISKSRVALAVLLFAFCVEFAQALHFIQWLGLAQYKLARMVLGTSFSWGDMVAYCFGFLGIVLVDRD